MEFRRILLCGMLSTGLLQAQSDETAPELVRVKRGSFDMGSEQGQPRERPVHRVTISRDFLVARYLVTFDDFDRFCAKTGRTRPPDREPGASRGRKPVRNVRWFDAVAYCNWLSGQEGLQPCYAGDGQLVTCDFEAGGYRLPTEAEWEYAARGGHLGDGTAFAGSDNPDETAWYKGNSGDVTHPVGLKRPNPLGIYDLCGNIFEWCWDWYADTYYAQSPGKDPVGAEPPGAVFAWKWEKSRRGGSWRESAADITVWTRSQDYAHYIGDNGFRVVRTAVPANPE
jgi:formylglycine-generating enzyme required for sulfatase activity